MDHPLSLSPLRAARLARGGRLDQIAALLGASVSQVSRWERGQGCPPASSVCQIASAYGLSEAVVARWFESASEEAA